MTPRRVYGTIPDMPVVMLAAIVLLSASLAGAQTPPAAPAAADRAAGGADPNVRAVLARLDLRAGPTAKAIPLLAELVAQEPGWEDGPLLLAEAYAGSADAYEREHHWRDAADAYAHALE